MSRLQELIAELCPDGVEYKTLGELGAFYGGLTGKTKKDFGDGAKFVTYNNVYGNPAVDLEEYGLVNVVSDERQNTVELGDVLFTISSENREEAGLTSVMTVDPGEPWYLNSFCTGWRLHDKSILLPNFLKHVLRGPEVREAISRTANGVTRFNISKPRLAKVRIPVPPIEVQREVVRILDEYTAAHDELVGQLEEEVGLTKLMFSNGLLTVLDSFENVTWGTIGDASERVVSGGTPSKSNKNYYGGDVLWLRTQEVDFGVVSDTGVKITQEGLANSSAQIIPENCLIVAMYGATAAKVAINAVPLSTNQACCNIQFNQKKVRTRFAFYWMMANYEKLKGMGRGSQNNISAGIVKGYPFPIVAVEQQDRLVYLMDGLKTACDSYVEELSHELTLRERQLALVRNQLLSFPENVA